MFRTLFLLSLLIPTASFADGGGKPPLVLVDATGKLDFSMLWEHQEIWVDTVGEMTLEGLRAGRYGPGRDVDPAGFLDL